MRTEHYDVVIIGSGAGGGTMAYALADSAARILVLERGEHGLPVLADGVVIRILEVEHEVHVDVEQAGIRLSALDVTAQPITGISDAT